MRKEWWYAVIGGAVGALLPIIIWLSLVPIPEPPKIPSRFREITCTGLNVVNSEGKKVIQLHSVFPSGATVVISGNGDAGVHISTSSRGGRIAVSSEHNRGVEIGTHEGGGQVVVGGKNGGRTVFAAGKEGAMLYLSGSADDSEFVGMRIDEKGKGRIAITDKAGNDVVVMSGSDKQQ